MADENKLIYQTSPVVTVATNQFVNVPVILQFDDTPLISVVRDQTLGYTTEIPIYHADGTYLAKANGTRVFPTKDGEKAGLKMRFPKDMTVCELDGRTVFEVYHQRGDAFRLHAELHTPSGFFVKTADHPLPSLINKDGKAPTVGGIEMRGNRFENVAIGIWLRSDGSLAMGVNKPRAS